MLKVPALIFRVS